MAGQIRSFRDLEVWRRSMALAATVYRLTQVFPKSEVYGLTGQLRRAAVSIPSNIAEGHIRSHSKEFRQFLYVALGSLAEVETQLLLASELGYVRPEQRDTLMNDIHGLGRQLRTLINRLPGDI